MKKTPQATHTHKRVGEVVVLQFTAELAQVSTTFSGDTFWVKRADLTQVGDPVQKSRKYPAKEA